ncbi:uncharacterized [Tachysurus ichikawai]
MALTGKPVMAPRTNPSVTFSKQPLLNKKSRCSESQNGGEGEAADEDEDDEEGVGGLLKHNDARPGSSNDSVAPHSRRRPPPHLRARRKQRAPFSHNRASGLMPRHSAALTAGLTIKL